MRKLAPLLALIAAVVGYLGYPLAQHYWALRQLREMGFDLRVPSDVDAETARTLQAQKYVDVACLAKPEVTSLLLRTRLDVNSSDDKGVTALHCLAAEGKLDQVRLFLDHGANVSPRADLTRDITAHKDLTPIHLAAAWHHLDVVELLRSRGANIDEPSHVGPPMMVALAVRGKDRFAAPAGRLPQEPDLLAVWQAFRKLGARADGTDAAGNSLLHVAMRAHQRPLIEAMLKSGDFDLNRPNRDGETPFMTFLPASDLAMIEDLIRRGADVNHRNNLGYAPILGTAFRPDLFDLLVRYGADPFVAQSGGRSIWSEMDNAPSEQIIRFAEKLPRLSRPMQQDGRPGSDPLHVFARESRPDLVDYFLKRGVSPNEISDTGNTPLHEVFEMPFGAISDRSQKYQVIRLLLDAGADPNARNAADMTPLMKAGREPPNVLQLLIARGADVNAVAIQEGQEKHVLDYFSERQNLEGFRLLLNAGADKTGDALSGVRAANRLEEPTTKSGR